MTGRGEEAEDGLELLEGDEGEPRVGRGRDVGRESCRRPSRR